LELSERSASAADVEGVLAFAEHVMVNATALWVNVAADGKRALQGALFPNGLEWDGQKFGTVVTCTAFSYLREISDSTERVASLSIPSWNQIAGFLETMGAIRKIPVRGDYIASIAN